MVMHLLADGYSGELQAVDLRVSNVVDVPNYVVSALLPEAIFDGE